MDFGRRGGTPAGNALIKKLISLGMTRSFLSADSEPSIPRLDFVRGGFIDSGKFVDLRAGSKTFLNEFKRTLAEARKSRTLEWLRPDGKSQVTVEYDGDRPVRVEAVVISTQHAETVIRPIRKPEPRSRPASPVSKTST